MWVRWLATVRSPRNSAAATSRFVRPSATRAATRRSAAVSPSSRVRPPMLPSSSRAFSTQVAAPSCSKPSSAASIASRAGALLPCAPADDAEREQRAGPPEGIADRPRAARPPAPGAKRPDRRPLRRRPRDRGSASRARAPTRGRAAPRPPPRRRGLAPPRRSGRARAAPRRSRRSTSGCSARPTRAPRPAGRPCRATPRPRRRLRSRARRARGSPGAAAGGARTAPPPARGLAPSARGRARAGRDGRRRARSGRWSCGTSSPYWIEMSCARAACSAASSQRPAQNSTQARPQSARALRGSSRSRHSWYSRSSSARASSLLSLTPRGCSTTRQRRLLHQLRAADGGREVVRSRRELRRLARRRRYQPRMACTVASARSKHVVVELVGELERRTGVLERSHVALPEARRPREPAVDDRLKRRARGRLAKRFLEQRRRHGRRSRARRGGREPRRATSRSPSRPAGRSRSSARASTPRRRDAHELQPALDDGARRASSGGVSRSACSASSAATADAPRSAASLAASSSTPATSASGASLDSAR